MQSVGSSPRAWGTRWGSTARTNKPRFIPTGVGNTPARSPPPSPATVHPHGRGEHAAEHAGQAFEGGSSPRAWGTLEDRLGLSPGYRFIPTGVGNTPRSCWPWPARTVHPHGRGEHSTSTGATAFGGGSSPRAWGTQPAAARRVRRHRFIPTGVGNTRTTCNWGGGTSGSSPRAWGTPLESDPMKPARRFIPTGVGNTIQCLDRSPGHVVHPHGRGEHIGAQSNSTSPVGSSPRAWGTLKIGRCSCGCSRFIPTGVGNTRPRGARQQPTPVHPHGRGEHTLRTAQLESVRGSSPRAWGTHAGSAPSAVRRRFIPTGVGNTRQPAGGWMGSAVHPHGRGEHRPVR